MALLLVAYLQGETMSGRNDLVVGVRERRVCLWLSDAEMVALRVRAAEAGFDSCEDYLWGLAEKARSDMYRQAAKLMNFGFPAGLGLLSDFMPTAPEPTPWVTRFVNEACAWPAADHTPVHGGYPTPTALAPSGFSVGRSVLVEFGHVPGHPDAIGVVVGESPPRIECPCCMAEKCCCVQF